ncbi:Uncharacterized protein ZC84.1 [Toxocara canis]|uniref:Uncharacterized protein ZC84.1 n=1 Tax=Toxocara canis TaxID=6265 RepID=A0A0B2VTH6_TOXCA|nr:Uncharacterized protein ZC84.1 [Toxocara canis]
MLSTEYASICCKTQPSCPFTESLALFEAYTSEPVKCAPNGQNPCPDGYTCQQAKNLEQICCTPPLECPFGMRALREQFGHPHICSPGVEGTCPASFICTRSLLNPSRFLCCQPQYRCLMPFLNMDTNKPIQCFPGENKCPPSTNCVATIDDSENVTAVRHHHFHCCHHVNVFICADGHMPLVNAVSGRPRRCNPSNPSACPKEHICEELADGLHACCPNRVVNELLCKEAILFNGVPRRCASWDDNSCNSGKCRIASDSKYYCCKAELS